LLTQHYKLPATLEHIKEARPGQFVYSSNDDDEVIGFVDFVSDCDIAIMLFEPTDISVQGATHISQSCDTISRLIEIFNQDQEIREMWRQRNCPEMSAADK